LAGFVRRRGTEIVGGLPELLEGLSRSLRFFFETEARSGAAASAMLTVPGAETVTSSFLPLVRALKEFDGRAAWYT
jgi:hypothetical protein